MTERESQYPFEKNMDWCSKNSSFSNCIILQLCSFFNEIAQSAMIYQACGRTNLDIHNITCHSISKNIVMFYQEHGRGKLRYELFNLHT